MAKALRRAWRRLSKARDALVGLPAALWRFALRLPREAELRERTLAHAVFAAIFAFALGSFDFLLTGGMDLSPDLSAVASEPVRAAIVDPSTTATFDPPPALVVPDVQPLDEMAAPNEGLLGGPGTVLAAWGLTSADISELPNKPQTIAFEDEIAAHSKSPQRL